MCSSLAPMHVMARLPAVLPRSPALRPTGACAGYRAVTSLVQDSRRRSTGSGCDSRWLNSVHPFSEVELSPDGKRLVYGNVVSGKRGGADVDVSPSGSSMQRWIGAGAADGLPRIDLR